MAKFTIDMPHVGESVTEAVIGKWLVSPGDTIRRYDPLVEVVTDKVNMEVPAPRDGTIVGLLVSEGDTVEMGAAIAEMEVEGAEPEQIPVADPVSDGPSVQAASRVGSMIVGANVGPTGGEFTDTSLQTESAVVEATESRASPSAESRSGQTRASRYWRADIAGGAASCRAARDRCEPVDGQRDWRSSYEARC